ncbi:MAG TPA: NAD-binding protein [Gammaproteobacteria bacterium]
MRAVIIGTSTLALMTAKILLKRGHEVVIIEKDKERIEALSESIDCGILHGDGSKPANLKEVDPRRTEVLCCLTGNDQTNIIASLVGRSLGFERIVTRIEDPEFEHICIELGLTDTIIPARTIGRHLADMFEGRDPLELSTMIRSEARTFSFVVKEEDIGRVSELNLPDASRVICIYRNDELLIPEEDTALKPGDEVIIITHHKNLANLKNRWSQT